MKYRLRTAHNRQEPEPEILSENITWDSGKPPIDAVIIIDETPVRLDAQDRRRLHGIIDQACKTVRMSTADVELVERLLGEPKI